ncbi:MAG TPA: histidine kinase [Pseudonocardiaceae bacterium]|jgi:two-component system sensor histidine kinase DesK
MPTARPRWAAYGCVLVLGLACVAALGPREIGVLMFALIAGAIVLPTGWAIGVTALLLAAMLGSSALSPAGPQWGEVIVFGSITWMMITMISLIRAVAQLREARERVAQLAVAEERVRVARDLHDVLGHSLTTITVKAGLARRLLEAGATDRAVAEVSDVEQLGRRALTEVRATVSAQRAASLPAEIASARAVLAAAGITAVLPQAVDNLDPQYHEPFAYVLREAITNVVRHSGARRCEVRMGSSWLEVHDDGNGPRGVQGGGVENGGVEGRDADVDGPGPGHGLPGSGHGLAGLRERLAQLGGTLETSAAPGGGFRLRASA